MVQSGGCCPLGVETIPEAAGPETEVPAAE